MLSSRRKEKIEIDSIVLIICVFFFCTLTMMVNFKSLGHPDGQNFLVRLQSVRIICDQSSYLNFTII